MIRQLMLIGSIGYTIYKIIQVCKTETEYHYYYVNDLNEENEKGEGNVSNELDRN